MFENLRLVLFVLLVIVNTAITAVVVGLLALFRAVLPFRLSKVFLTRLANGQFWLWATFNLWMLNTNNKIEWTIEGEDELSRDQWYLMMSNHISWADIVIVSSVLKNKIPMTKFFLKYELLYVPFVGLACWCLDMPFMKRHSREFLIKHPERRNDDFDAINKACEKFSYVPTTLVNFVEGTRVNEGKLATVRTPYQHLLKPKTGGVAFALNAMGDLLDGIVDVTLAYPDNQETPFTDLLKGRLTRVVVHVKLHPMDENVSGDYFNDKTFKRRFHKWLDSQWKEKDEVLKSIYNKDSV